MTNTGGSTTPAGWYTDPGGSGHLRWWDGTAWSAHLAPQPTPAPTPVVPVPQTAQQPEVSSLPPVAQPAYEPAVLTADNEPYVPFQGSWNQAPQTFGNDGASGGFATPAQWNTAGVWLLAFSGALTYVAIFVAITLNGARISTPYGSGSVIGSSLVAYLLSLFFAEADRRKLRSLGYVKVPSLWWMLLAPPLVYLIIRTVNVWSEVRKGIAPLITYFAVSVLCGIALAAALAPLFAGALGGSSAQFAASLQTGLDQKGGHFTVTCPSSIPTTVGSSFSCRAVDSSGIAHTLSIQVIKATDGKPGVKLISVTPAISG